MTRFDIPKGLPVDRVWLPVSDQTSAQQELRLLYQAQQAAPHPTKPMEADQV